MENGGDPLILRRKLIREGSTDSDIRRAKADGTILPIRRGAFVTASAPHGLRPEDKHVLDIRAHASAAQSSLVVSHQSAAVLHGIPMWAPDLTRVHFITDRASGGRRTAQRHIHAAPLDSRDIMQVNGIEVTTPARTVADLMRTMPFEASVCVGDAALKAELVTVETIRDALVRSPGRGTTTASQALEFSSAQSESVGESRSRVRLQRLGFPDPALQVTLRGPSGEFVARTDFLWWGIGVIGEFDGMVKYTKYVGHGKSAADVIVAEKQREDHLRSLGWVVVRWTWSDLDNPQTFATLLQRAFDRASALPDPTVFGRRAEPQK